MIVKNERHIIRETLDNLVHINNIKFSYWVISDTGSTDGTQEFIKDYFREKNIPGELFEDKWQDFAHNRNKAMEHAFDKSDYLFFFDADDLIHGDFKFPDKLDKDTYKFKFGTGFTGHEDDRIYLINNREKIAKYVGVLHEVLNVYKPNFINELVDGEYHFESRRLGDRSKNPNKYKNDAEVLEKAFHNENTDLGLKYRYAYYCAQSYRDAHLIEKSTEWFKLFLDLPTGNQYKYCACANLGDNYKKLNNMEEALNYWYKAIPFDRERRESVVKIMEYYFNKSNHFAVNMLYERMKNYKLTNPDGKIFLDMTRYHDIDYYNSIVSCYIGEWMSGYYSCKNLLLNDKWTEITLQNFTCYGMNMHLDKDNKPFLDKLLELFEKYFDTKKELVKKLWNMVSKDIKEYLPEQVNVSKEYQFNKLDDKYNNKKNQHKIPFEEASNKILIYTGHMNFLWNDSTLKEKSIGGAEKAVIYLSRCLPKNYEIYIAGDQLEEELDNIKYINHSNLQKLLDENNFHTIIVSRYVSFFEEFDNIKCYKMLLSAHDSTGFINFKVKNISINNILLEYNKYIDNVICLTKWHSSNIVERHPFLKEKINIINNGIDISQFIYDKPKVKNKFVWSSCSYRGLIILLNLWGELLKSIPDATLDICSYDTFPKNKEDEKMLEIINMHSSITHLGKLNTKQLYDLMSISEYWLYTNTFPETSCITAMEMLMSGVICLYYPLAGLVDTIGDYGIKVDNGNEVETIMNLSEETKAELIKNGKEYALSCSWKNRALKWCSLLGLNKIGIFNSFPFHYEMFGFILNYALNHHIEVDIFTNTQNDLGWIDFYREKFNNFNVIDFKKFEGNTNNYSTFFVTTDDDPLFKTEWIDNNVVCLNHYYKIRSPNFKHYLNVANFKDSPLEYSYPCYPLINYKEKKQNTTVCVIGGGNIHTNHNIDIINRLESKNKIILNIFVRKICNTNISGVDTSKFNINFIEDIETQEMVKILKQSSYILINYNRNEDHNNGISCSGSLQLALSTLCKPIMVHTSNKYLQIENALEFDMNSNEYIVLDEEINFELLEEERSKYIDKFYKYMDEFQSTIYLRILSNEGVSNNLETWMNTDNLKYMYNKPVIEIKVFIIHYKKLTDRKEFILKQFEREQITNYEFITIDRDELNDYDLLKFNKNYSKPLAANFLSHLYAYKQISSNNYKYNLILEDDVILCRGFSNRLNSYIKQIPEDFDSVFIGEGCNIQEHHINQSNIIKNKNIYICNNENKCKCTDSYMISTKCANKLVKYYNSLSMIDEPIDYFLNKPLKSLNVYWAEPTLIKQGTIIGLFNSSIGNGMIKYNVGFNPNVLTCYKSPFEKIRVGQDFDGGYIICDIPNIKYELLLSGGISDDISFEEEFCNKYPDCICNAYDGTINTIDFTNKNINFFKKNINNFNDDNNTNLHLDLENHSNIFLKMDIEGYEIPWIKTLKEDHLTRISQIVIEFHFPFNNTEIEVFNKLNKYFKIIHFHANNCCGTRNHNGVIIPNVFECTYLNLKFFNNYYELNTEVIPGVLDMKNVLENNEIIINYEPFVNNLNFKTNFLTFGCDKYTKTLEQIKMECENINIFDNILIRNVDYLKKKSEFWNKHEHFIINNKRGFGYWIWKPFLIYDTLLQMNFNDILVYCDSGCEINQKGKKRLEEYFKIVSNSPYGILSFQMSHHKEYKWTKMDIFKEINIEIGSSNFNSGQLIGGIIIIKKCEHSLKVFKEILEISENYNLINDSQSNLKNHPDFIENRHDQSISSIIRKKHGTEIIEVAWFSNVYINDDTIPIYAKRIRL